jgi:hypothetical protein
MSEYQYVAFRAVDRPVSEENLEYMHDQSSRAEITSWSFDNEYHYGDFRGNAEEMLRRGYDIHVHYASFGIRTLMLRLPNGIPSAKRAEPYFGRNELSFKKDKTGKGGVLIVSPYDDGGELDALFDLDDMADRLAPLRAEILDGDLRPLYLAHLAMACDSNHDRDETREGPVPAGLGELTKAQIALAEFYCLSDALLAAAATESPPHSNKTNVNADHLAWVEKLPAGKKDAWLARLLSDSQAAVRAEVIDYYRAGRGDLAWPTRTANRTIGELFATADSVAKERAKKAAEKAAQMRAERLAEMRADPAPFLKQADKLVGERSSSSYRKAAETLAELRDALADGRGADLPEQHARKLRDANPTLNHLKKALREKGFAG